MPKVVVTATSELPISSHSTNRSTMLRARWSARMRDNATAKPAAATASTTTLIASRPLPAAAR